MEFVNDGDVSKEAGSIVTLFINVARFPEGASLPNERPFSSKRFKTVPIAPHRALCRQCKPPDNLPIICC
jgi:hypothetical protein